MVELEVYVRQLSNNKVKALFHSNFGKGDIKSNDSGDRNIKANVALLI